MSARVRVCSVAELPAQGSVKRVDVEGLPVALVATGGEFFALDDTCTHDEVSLSDGEVEGHTVECWLHGSKFDVRTGEALCLPAKKPVAVFDVTLDGDAVYVSAAPTKHFASTTSLESNTR